MLGRYVRGLGALAVVCGALVFLIFGGACGSAEGVYDESFYIEGCRGWTVATCESDADCYSGIVFEPGTRCFDGHCLCAVDGQVMCNFLGHPPENDMRGCYFPEQCQPGELCGPEEGSGGAGVGGSGGTGGAGGAGGVGGAGGAGGAGGEPEKPCVTAADCPGPPSWRCGQATCLEGVCGVASIAEPGELVAIDSQIKGDCQTQMCDSMGYLIVVPDGYDILEDGKRCTIDFCGPGSALNVALEDGSPCPGGSGWCFGEECVECIDTIPGTQDCGPGNACQGVYCVSGGCGASCGGACAPCPAGYNCSVSSDCEDSVCSGGMCALPTCSDTKKNDGETDADCGMAICNVPCEDGKGCATGVDCVSGVCWAGICQASTCTDGTLNGNETGVDCGGPCVACGGP